MWVPNNLGTYVTSLKEYWIQNSCIHFPAQLWRLLYISLVCQTQRFDTASNKVHHWTCAWASFFHIPHPQPMYIRSILMLTFHLFPGLPRDVPTKILYDLSVSFTLATCSTHLHIHNFTILTTWNDLYISLSSSSVITYVFLLRRDCFLSTLCCHIHVFYILSRDHFSKIN